MARGPAEAALQAELISIILPAIEHLGFVIAGGHVVRLHGIRPGRLSDDLDLFTNIVGSNATTARDIVIEAVHGAGHEVELDPISNDGFVRLNITTVAGVTTKVELGIDWRKDPPTILSVGPVLSIGDSFASKVLTLWGRSAPRDALDVYAYLQSSRFTKDDALERAAEYDAGFTASDSPASSGGSATSPIRSSPTSAPIRCRSARCVSSSPIGLTTSPDPSETELTPPPQPAPRTSPSAASPSRRSGAHPWCSRRR
ncbi:nucleotidyl transferase AbiEii/AbiGii toxin family protein [Microbacteriaceae bacterium VKM Ac-2854]|nr:nucleotidyl transferase AbiEii/AbiGii toxin family protein [Microbacteriaceae bacterium VKM Ac-2854]